MSPRVQPQLLAEANTLVKTVTKPPNPCSSTEWFDLGQDFVSLSLIFLISKGTIKPIVLPSVQAYLVFPGWGMSFSSSGTVWPRPEGLLLDLLPFSLLTVSHESSPICLYHLLNITQSVLAAVRLCRVYLIRGSCPHTRAPRVYTVPAFVGAVQDTRDAKVTVCSQGAS